MIFLYSEGIYCIELIDFSVLSGEGEEARLVVRLTGEGEELRVPLLIIKALPLFPLEMVLLNPIFSNLRVLNRLIWLEG